VEQIDGGGERMKILLIAAVVLVGIIVVSAGTRRKETFNTLDAVVEDTRERFKRGEYDD
jgi:uncharacterized membrane protein